MAVADTGGHDAELLAAVLRRFETQDAEIAVLRADVDRLAARSVAAERLAHTLRTTSDALADAAEAYERVIEAERRRRFV